VNFVRGIAGIAAVVAVFCRFGSWTQIVTFMGSVVVLFICHFVLVNLDDNYMANMKDGYWPSNPANWSAVPDRTPPSEENRLTKSK
jgi:hypothetical protein